MTSLCVTSLEEISPSQPHGQNYVPDIIFVIVYAVIFECVHIVKTSLMFTEFK